MLHSCWVLEPGLLSIWGSLHLVWEPHMLGSWVWPQERKWGGILDALEIVRGCSRQSFLLQMGIWQGHWGEHTDGAGDCQQSFNNHLWTGSQFKSCSSSRVPWAEALVSGCCRAQNVTEWTGTISASSTWTWLCLSDIWGVYEHTGSFDCSFFLKQIISCS